MKRCGVWWINFEPSIGGKITKKRPAVIVSNDASNKFLNRVQVIPLTSRTDRVYPSEALVVFDGNESKAMADQLATVSKLRLIQRAGILSREDIWKIEEAIKVQLNIFGEGLSPRRCTCWGCRRPTPSPSTGRTRSASSSLSPG